MRFTQWGLKLGLPAEPMVVIDVGVQGGEHPRWNVFGNDRLIVHGFDAIREVVDGLNTKHQGRTNRHYHWMAIGNEDGEKELFFNAADPFSSSLYQQGHDAYTEDGQRSDSSRRVPIRRLDSLLEDGTIQPSDFLKVDVEGFEKNVFLGAKKLLASGLFALDVETNLSASPEYLTTHFGTLLEIATQHGLRAFDLNFNRIPTASFQHALEQAGGKRVNDAYSVGKVCSMNVFFGRDLVAERESPQSYIVMPPPPRPQQIVKMMMILESYGLNDIAIDVAKGFRNELAPLFDVDTAVRLLADRDCRIADPVNAVLRSYSWKITAPLRGARRTVGRFIKKLRRSS